MLQTCFSLKLKQQREHLISYHQPHHQNRSHQRKMLLFFHCQITNGALHGSVPIFSPATTEEELKASCHTLRRHRG